MRLHYCALLVLLVFTGGCLPFLLQGMKSSPRTAEQPTEVTDVSGEHTPEPGYSPVIDNYPTISGRVSPSNPSLGQSVSLTISATDDKGIEGLYWESSVPSSSGEYSVSFDCNRALECSHTWELVADAEGSHEIAARAIDLTGKDAAISLFLTVQQGIAPAPTSPSPPPSPSTSTAETAQPTEPPASEGCTSNSDCGYKQVCQSRQCVTVQCTTDSQCSGCRRCSGNSCVSCGYGPYGCYC